MTTPQLPPLPEPYCVHHRLDRSGSTSYFSADQMRAYALAAIGSLPVHAHLWQHKETGRTKVVRPDEVWTASNAWAYVGPLVLAAPIKKEQEA